MGAGCASDMIVCSCNIIARRDIESVIEEILVADPLAVLTPGLLYHRLGYRGRCCGCLPHVSRIIVEHTPAVRARINAGDPPQREEDLPQSDAA